jgi:hypothetical protein
MVITIGMLALLVEECITIGMLALLVEECITIGMLALLVEEDLLKNSEQSFRLFDLCIFSEIILINRHTFHFNHIFKSLIII